MHLTIIGCGNMGSALAQRLSPHYKLFLYDRNVEKTEHLEKQGFGKACKQLPETLRQSDIVILAIKPQNLHEAIDLIYQNGKSKKPLLVSLLTGTPLAKLQNHFPNYKIIRMMPNLPMIHGEGLIGLSASDDISEKEQQPVTELCQHLGKVYWIPESKIDAFTALAGSGPGFAFVLIEAMIDAGINLGFSVKDSQDLVHQMLKGSLLLLEKSGKHPGELKWQVTSPAGTTIAGLRQLEKSAFRGAIIDTFFAAYERAKHLNGV